MAATNTDGSINKLVTVFVNTAVNKITLYLKPGFPHLQVIQHSAP